MDVSNEVFNYSKDIDIKICNLEEENMPYDDNSIDII